MAKIRFRGRVPRQSPISREMDKPKDEKKIPVNTKGMGRRAGSKKGYKVVVEARSLTIVELYMQDMSQDEIAKKLGISQTVVSHTITECRRVWRERREEMYADRVAEEEAKLRDLEAKARNAYDLSTRRFVRDGRVFREIPIRYPGNPQFLEVAKKCVETRLKIMGALTGPTININQQVSVFDMIAGVEDQVGEVLEQDGSTTKANAKATRVLGKDMSDQNGIGAEGDSELQQAIQDELREAEEEFGDEDTDRRDNSNDYMDDTAEDI